MNLLMMLYRLLKVVILSAIWVTILIPKISLLTLLALLYETPVMDFLKSAYYHIFYNRRMTSTEMSDTTKCDDFIDKFIKFPLNYLYDEPKNG